VGLTRHIIPPGVDPVEICFEWSVRNTFSSVRSSAVVAKDETPKVITFRVLFVVQVHCGGLEIHSSASAACPVCGQRGELHRYHGKTAGSSEVLTFQGDMRSYLKYKPVSKQEDVEMLSSVHVL
jgi:hypothetical protein